jgi:RNA polymerase sigma-70 factor (ECF subfamily)
VPHGKRASLSHQPWPHARRSERVAFILHDVFRYSFAEVAEIVRDFKQAQGAKDIDALIGLLDPDATTIADGGGLVTAALRPIEGAEQIARRYVDIAGQAPNLTILERTVNGQPGLVAQQDGVTVTVFAFDVAGDQIKHIWAVRNPEKLRPWTTGRRGRET